MATHLPIKNEFYKRILVDDEDAPVLMRYHWYIPIDSRAVQRPYAWIPREGKRHPRVLSLSRILTKARKGQYVQHINGDPLDCRRENLQLVDSSLEACRTVWEEKYKRWTENPLIAPDWA